MRELEEGQDVDVERIMERVRESMRRRGGAIAGGASPGQNGPAVADLTSLQSLYDIQRVSLSSHRRLVGPLVVGLKRALRMLLTPFFEKQVAYNAANARVVTHVKEGLASLERQQRESGETVNGRIDVLQGAQAQVNDKIRDALASVGRLREELREELRQEFRGELGNAESRLRGEIAAIPPQFQTLNQRIEATRERASGAERKLRRIVRALMDPSARAGRPEEKPAADRPVISLQELEPAFDYAGFEERFRGTEEDIKERQRAYVEYFRGRADVLDIGSGRGEFLELMREEGISARGVDRDLDMVLLCEDKGLDVVRGDLFEFLEAIPDESIGGVFGAQVIEHVRPQRIIDLVKLCHHKLASGGVLVLETPNPKCLWVFADTFYRDLTHIQPIHPDTMRFLLRAVGFHDVEVTFSGPVDASVRIPALPVAAPEGERFNAGIERLNALLFGFQDYAVIGRKGMAGSR